MNETIKIKEAYFEPPFVILVLKDDRIVRIKITDYEVV